MKKTKVCGGGHGNMQTMEMWISGHVDIDNGHVDVRTCGHEDMCIRGIIPRCGCGQWTCGCVMSTCGQAPTC